MATIDKKKQLVADLQSRLTSSKVAVFADYRGLNVANATALRVSFREAGAELMVAKNTLTKIAADRVGIQGLEQLLTGPTIIAFGYADQTTPSKLLNSFLRTNRSIDIKGGLLDGRVISARDVRVLADLPSREVLISQVMRGLQGPIAGLQSVLAGPIRKLVTALQAIQEQKAAS
ncbi:MAG: 50S ribosomal protein L10 [Thermacetogeniaceae bacterium]|jgi:large subunit ribosomal protein L10